MATVPVRAVLDANVLISARIGRHDRAPSQILDAWREGRFELVVSARLIEELHRAFSYPKLARLAGPDGAGAWIASVAEAATCVPDPDAQAVGFQDIKDEYLIALGRQPTIDYLVSGDGPLHQLETPGLSVITPRGFLDLLLER